MLSSVFYYVKHSGERMVVDDRPDGVYKENIL